MDNTKAPGPAAGALAAPRSPGRRPRGAALLLMALALLMVLAFLALIPLPRSDGELIGSDGIAYYVFVRSLVVDGDLDLTNEFAHFWRAYPHPPDFTPTGRVGNKLAIGPAVLWLPFFVVAHAFAAGASKLGWSGVADGYGFFYQAAISIGSIAYGVAGLWLSFHCAARLVAAPPAVAAALLFWTASNAVYYAVLEPSMAHMVALFSVSALLTMWLLWLVPSRIPSLRQSALLGAGAGLVLLVRLQDAPALLLPFAAFAAALVRSARAGAWSELRRLACGAGVATGCAALVFLPQVVVWREMYGAWLALPYLNEHDPPFYWLAPRVGEVLLSSFRGVFVWHPVYLAAVAGLFMLAKRLPAVGLPLIGLAGLNVYVVAAWWSWWQGDAFGGRMFLSLTWCWVMGLAVLLEWLRRRLRHFRLLPLAPVGGAIAITLIAWNVLAMAQYRLALVPPGAPLTWRQITVDRVTLPWTLWQRAR